MITSRIPTLRICQEAIAYLTAIAGPGDYKSCNHSAVQRFMLSRRKPMKIAASQEYKAKIRSKISWFSGVRVRSPFSIREISP